MKQFLKFLTKIKSFWKFYKNYEYDGEDAEFIIENYKDVLLCRTGFIKDPTYRSAKVIEAIDYWYEEQEKVKICRMRNELMRKCARESNEFITGVSEIIKEMRGNNE